MIKYEKTRKFLGISEFFHYILFFLTITAARAMTVRIGIATADRHPPSRRGGRVSSSVTAGEALVSSGAVVVCASVVTSGSAVVSGREVVISAVVSGSVVTGGATVVSGAVVSGRIVAV